MANNRLDKLYLDKTKLETIANGGTITSGSDTYTADENALYFIDEEIDSTPTQNSNNPVSSGGVYTALANKEDKITSTNKLSADLIEDGTTNKVFTATEQTKLSGIESGAEVNDVTDFQVNGTSVVNNKVGNIVTNTAYDATNNKFATMNDLPTDTGATSVEVTGSGNAIDSASYDSSTRKLTLTKGITALTQHQDISGKQDKTDNSLDTTSKTVVGAINEVNSVAKGANQAKGFASYSALITALNSASATAYNVGQSFYIQTLEVPDLWIISVESSSSSYTYTTDSAFITATGASGGQQVGYYKLAQLETQKVDLANYSLKSATVSNVSYDSTNKKIQQTINGSTSDVVAFGANAFTNTTIPTSASDVSALPSSTKYGASLSVSGTSVQLKDQDGNNLGSAITTQDTTYSSLSASSGGTDVSLVTTGEKYNWDSSYELYATYTMQTGVSSYRFQICDAGDFTNYNYKIVFSTPSVASNSALYLRYGDDSSDLDRTSPVGFCKYGVEKGSGQTQLITPMGYYGESTHEFNYSYGRTGEINIEFDVQVREFSGETYIYMIGQSGRPFDGGNYSFFAWDICYDYDTSSITHIHIYADSNFTDNAGSISIYRGKK